MVVRSVAMASRMISKYPWKGNFLGGAELALATEKLVNLEVVFWNVLWYRFRAEFHPVGMCLRVTVRMAASCHGIHCL